jgi:hypothetical protein
LGSFLAICGRGGVTTPFFIQIIPLRQTATIRRLIQNGGRATGAIEAQTRE